MFFSAPETALNMAVDAFKRSRLIDAATSDDDDVTPLYKLDEISDLLRTSPGDVVRDITDHLMKRLDHKSPIVKQKVLRVIKFSVGKAGPEFKREIQRHSGTIRGMFHYRGQPDVLRGDALNKGVRDTARDAIQAMFVEAPKGGGSVDGGSGLGKRIQGFGSGGEGMGRGGAMGDRENRRGQGGLSGMIGLGSASLRSGLEIAAEVASNIAATYRLGTRRPLASVNAADEGWGGDGGKVFGGYRGVEDVGGLVQGRGSAEWSGGRRSEDWGSRPSPRLGGSEVSNMLASPRGGIEHFPSGSEGLRAGSVPTGVQLEEDRLVERITNPGGVRVQPTTEALREFMISAQQLDGSHLARALERKLCAHAWQSRLKALCVMEAMLRRGRGSSPSTAAVYHHFANDANSVVDCLALPQTSVCDRAKKVLELLSPPDPSGEHQPSQTQKESREGGRAQTSAAAAPAEAPKESLIDMGEADLLSSMGASGTGPLVQQQDEARWIASDTVASSAARAASHDLLGEDLLSDIGLSYGAAAPRAMPEVSSVPLSLGESGRLDDAGLFSGLDLNGQGNFEANSNADVGVSIFDGMNLSDHEPGTSMDGGLGVEKQGPVRSGSTGGQGQVSKGGLEDPMTDLFGGLTLGSSAVLSPSSLTVSKTQSPEGGMPTGAKGTGNVGLAVDLDGEGAVPKGKAGGAVTVGATEAFKGVGFQRPEMKPMGPGSGVGRGGAAGQGGVPQPGVAVMPQMAGGAVAMPPMGMMGISGMGGMGMGVGLYPTAQGFVPVQFVSSAAFVPTQFVAPTGAGAASSITPGGLGSSSSSLSGMGGMSMGMGMGMGMHGVGQGVLGTSMGGVGDYYSDFMGDPTAPSLLSSAESTKKNETRAFDFISDHVSAAVKHKQTSG